MKSAEREGKSANFVVPKDRMVFAPGLEGGVGQNFGSRYGEAAFPYVPHFAVVSHFESAPTLRTREKGGDESDPPQTGGACDLE